jgi:hypothetical protein
MLPRPAILAREVTSFRHDDDADFLPCVIGLSEPLQLLNLAVR